MSDKKKRISLADTAGEEAAENLSVLRLEKGYGGKAKMQVLRTGMFTGGKKDKPRLDLTGPDGKEWYIALNRTNTDFIREAGFEYLDELEGKTITVEVYETGGTGTYAFGIRIIEVK